MEDVDSSFNYLNVPFPCFPRLTLSHVTTETSSARCVDSTFSCSPSQHTRRESAP